MPLLKGKSEIGHNIREMEAAGHPRKQAIAAALREARDTMATAPNAGLPQGGMLRAAKDNITHAKQIPYNGSVNGGKLRADFSPRGLTGWSGSAAWNGRRV